MRDNPIEAPFPELVEVKVKKHVIRIKKAEFISTPSNLRKAGHPHPSPSKIKSLGVIGTKKRQCKLIGGATEHYKKHSKL